MDSDWGRLFLLVPLFAVVTLPAGILAGLLFGLVPALVVFVVGWLLLVPMTAIVLGGALVDTTAEIELDGVDEETVEAAMESVPDDGERVIDPVEVLRQRYARGEIDERELEQRLEALLETERINTEDEQEIERTIDRLEDDESELLTEDE